MSAPGAVPRPLKIGIGGPVGSGKTALVETLARRLRDHFDMAVITNDIYTQEDAQFLVRRGALPADRVVGVETGGCPHTAIREDASVNLEAVHDLVTRFPDLELLFAERLSTPPSTSSTWRRATRSRARVGRGSCARTCS